MHDSILRIHLVPAPDPSGPEFEAEPEEVRPEPPHPGLRGWFERKLQRLLHFLHDSDTWLMRQLRRIWAWLNLHTFADEPLLARLRSAESIVGAYPTELTETEARGAWSAYLAGRWRRHWPWFLFNLFISPLTIVLGPLPGPNVVGYWFTYRAVRHGLILLGLRRARLGRVATSWHVGPDREREGREDLEPTGVGRTCDC